MYCLYPDLKRVLLFSDSFGEIKQYLKVYIMRIDVKTRREHNSHSCFFLSLLLCYINIRAPVCLQMFWITFFLTSQKQFSANLDHLLRLKWPQCPNSPDHLGLPLRYLSCTYLIRSTVTHKWMASVLQVHSSSKNHPFPHIGKQPCWNHWSIILLQECHN